MISLVNNGHHIEYELTHILKMYEPYAVGALTVDTYIEGDNARACLRREDQMVSEEIGRAHV